MSSRCSICGADFMCVGAALGFCRCRRGLVGVWWPRVLWFAGVCSLVLFWRLLVRRSVGLVGRSRVWGSCLARVAWARAGLVVGAVFGVASLVSVVRGRGWCPRSLGCLVGVRCVFEVVRARLPRGFDGGGAVVCLGCVCMLCGCRVVVLFGAPGVGFVGLRWFLCVCVGFVVAPVVVWVVVCWVRCRFFVGDVTGCWQLGGSGVAVFGFGFVVCRLRCGCRVFWLVAVQAVCGVDRWLSVRRVRCVSWQFLFFVCGRVVFNIAWGGGALCSNCFV